MINSEKFTVQVVTSWKFLESSSRYELLRYGDNVNVLTPIVKTGWGGIPPIHKYSILPVITIMLFFDADFPLSVDGMRKNKCETNKCKKACWEINAMSKNCDVATSAMSCKPDK